MHMQQLDMVFAHTEAVRTYVQQTHDLILYSYTHILNEVAKGKYSGQPAPTHVPWLAGTWDTGNLSAKNQESIEVSRISERPLIETALE